MAPILDLLGPGSLATIDSSLPNCSNFASTAVGAKEKGNRCLMGHDIDLQWQSEISQYYQRLKVAIERRLPRARHLNGG